MRTCKKCFVVKGLDEFHVHSHGKYKRATLCKVCKNEDSAIYYAKNSVELVAARQARQKADPIKGNAVSSVWRKKNPAKCNAMNAKNRAGKIQATPAWADQSRIECYYSVAAMLNREGLQKWHVDHFYPLNGKTVSGLHVDNNLRVIPAVENLRKGNRVESYII